MLMSRYEDEWERQIDVNVKVGDEWERQINVNVKV